MAPATLDLMRTTRSDNTEWRWYEIQALRVQGLSMGMIARRLELDFKTVRRYLRADSVEQLVAGGVRTSKLDPFKPYLHQRLTAGARKWHRAARRDRRTGLHRQLQHPGAIFEAAAP